MARKSKSASVIVVDDHAIFRMGAIQTLSMSPRLSVVGEGASRDNAIELMEQLEPDIALLDISMPGNGLDTARDIQTRWPDTRIVILTVSEEDEDVFRAAELGCEGYILKGTSATSLISAMETVADGGNFISPALGVRLMGMLKNKASGADQPAPTRQEWKVLSGLLAGKSNPEIARELELSVKTVKFHFTSLFQKTGARNRVELALMAAELAKKAPK